MASKELLLTQFFPASHLQLPEVEALLARLFPPLDDTSELLLAVEAADYAASAISRAVEDCDAHLLNLNILSDITEADERLVAIRIDHRNPLAVIRSLERYGIKVMAISPAPDADDEASDDRHSELMRARARELLRYLEI